MERGLSILALEIDVGLVPQEDTPWLSRHDDMPSGCRMPSCHALILCHVHFSHSNCVCIHAKESTLDSTSSIFITFISLISLHLHLFSSAFSLKSRHTRSALPVLAAWPRSQPSDVHQNMPGDPNGFGPMWPRLKLSAQKKNV